MNKKTRILFVDDEPNVLNGIRRSLHAYKKEWDMSFCEGAQAALAHLEENEKDIIFSDMRMPKMDGSELLRQVQCKYPEMIRIVLSGYSEKEQIMKTINVAHQYLSKPCNPKVISAVIQRTTKLLRMIRSKEVKAFVGKIETLPTPPNIYNEIIESISNENCTPNNIAKILETDPAIVSKLLKIVNSSFFALGRSINKCEDAVACLGYETIRGFILKEEIFTTIPSELATQFNLDQWRLKALKIAKLSRQIIKDHRGTESQAQDAFIGGLLQNIGELILLQYNPAQYMELRESCACSEQSPIQAEEEAYGENHATLGAYLIELWGLSYELSESIAYHHSPQEYATESLGVAGACYLASQIVEHEFNEPCIEGNEVHLQFLKQYSISPEKIAEYKESLTHDAHSCAL